MAAKKAKAKSPDPADRVDRRHLLSPIATFWTRPVTDFLHTLDRCLAGGSRRDLVLIFAGLVLGWWLYVPVHELLHVAGCVVAGGTVDELELAPLYGGTLLAEILPFVVPESDYAGRLSGFDTHGRDSIYLATDLAPFVLTVWPGVWGMLAAGRRGRSFLFGLTLPIAFAPFLSLTGDAYEIGSILVTRWSPWSAAETVELLRSDDLVRLVSELGAVPEAPWGGAVLAFLLGVLWAWGVYALGRVVTRNGSTSARP